MKQKLGERVFQESELTLCLKNCQRNSLERKILEYWRPPVFLIVDVPSTKIPIE